MRECAAKSKNGPMFCPHALTQTLFHYKQRWRKKKRDGTKISRVLVGIKQTKQKFRKTLLSFLASAVKFLNNSCRFNHRNMKSENILNKTTLNSPIHLNKYFSYSIVNYEK